MKKLAEELSQIAELNDLIQSLQESLELFEQGNKGVALEKIRAVEASLEDLKNEELVRPEEVDENLDQVLKHLKWIKENADGRQDEE